MGKKRRERKREKEGKIFFSVFLIFLLCYIYFNKSGFFVFIIVIAYNSNYLNNYVNFVMNILLSRCPSISK